MLNATQTLAAAELLKNRPAVIEGTRVIVNDGQRARYYSEVEKVMRSVGIKDQAAVNEFCDLAGVPD
jgi:hypothetical protein